MKPLKIITKITLLPIIFIFIYLLFSCKKDKEDRVPYVYVDFYINLNEDELEIIENWWLY